MSVVRVVVTATNSANSPATLASVATGVIQAGAAPDPGGGVGEDRLPGRPTDLSVVAWHKALDVTWGASETSGSPVTNYLVTVGSSSCLTRELSCTIAGLTNGVKYDVSVQALSGGGWGPAATASAQPVAGTIAPEIKRAGRFVTVSGTLSGFLPSDTSRDPESILLTARIGAGRPLTRNVAVLPDGSFTWKRRVSPAKAVTVSLRHEGVQSAMLISRAARKSGL